MTVPYFQMVSEIGFASFVRLLFRWQGSVFKLVWKNLIVYLVLYYIVFGIHRVLQEYEVAENFTLVCLYCSEVQAYIPLSFILGFYVNLVVTRWWGTYLDIPWPETLGILLSSHIGGQDTRSRIFRCTIARYTMLALVMTFSMIAPEVKKVYPSLQQMADDGFMTQKEKEILENMEGRTKVHKAWVPIMWAGKVVARARREERIRDDVSQRTLMTEIARMRGCLGSLLGWDEYNIPLVYTQVVTMAVTFHFIFALFSSQVIKYKAVNDILTNTDADTKKEELLGEFMPETFPVLTIIQFIFYVGWLKVAECLINPFGEDDHDFDFSQLLDRHIRMTYLMADPQPEELPTLVRDESWDGTRSPTEEEDDIETIAFIQAKKYIKADKLDIRLSHDNCVELNDEM